MEETISLGPRTEPSVTYVTQEARRLQEEATLANYKVKAILYNIHGDWDKKKLDVNGVIWHVKDNEQQNEETIKGEQESQFSGSKATETKKTRIVTKEAHGFPRRSGCAMIPLGGPRGYICGMFRAACRTRGWNRKGSKYFGALSFIDNGGFQITPQWVAAEKDAEIKMRPFFVQEAKGEIYFEYIEKVPVEFNVSVMQNHLPEDMTLQLMGDLERLAIGPKRRGTLKIESIQKT